MVDHPHAARERDGADVSDAGSSFMDALATSHFRALFASQDFRQYVPAQNNGATHDRSRDHQGPNTSSDHNDDEREFLDSTPRSSQDCYSDDELAAMDVTHAFSIPDAETVQKFVNSAAAKLQSKPALPCAVCEMAFDDRDLQCVRISDEFLETAKKILVPRAGADISEIITAQYNASTIDLRLEGLLLYPPAVFVQSSSLFWQLCQTCHGSLKKKSLPKLAIANGNYIGWYPNESVPWLEEQLLARVSASVSIKTVTGGSGRCLRSHHFVVKNTEGPILEMLPLNPASQIRVTMIKAMTPTQIAICKRRHTIDAARCRRALQFLQTSHRAYKTGVDRDFQVLSASYGDVVEDRTSATSTAVPGPIVERIDFTSSYAIASPDEIGSATDENQWVEETSLLMDQSEQTDDFLVRQSTVFTTSHQWECCVEMFPLLFPGGCGGPREPRAKPMSVETWATRVLQLHENRFERHEVFLLLLFDFLALHNARKRMFFRVRASQDAVKAGAITQQVIAECVLYRQHLLDCKSRGTTPRAISPTIREVLDIQRGVEAGEVAYYGSNRARSQARGDLFGYLKRLGPLHVFFTLSPDASGVYTIGVSCGEIDSSLLLEANRHLLPTKIERRKIASRHPVSCARYFMRVVGVVIEDIFGWDQAEQRPVKGGGLFGVVRAFTVSAETQVSGDLHAHMVVWLHGMPSTASEMESALGLPSFRSRFIALVDTVTTASVPLLGGNCPRNECGGALQTSDFPLSAYQRSSKRGTAAPVTSSCAKCNATFGSYDLIDTALHGDQALTPSQLDYLTCSDPTMDDGVEALDTPERSPNHFSARPDYARRLAAILRSVQVHYWHHTSSCFKITKKTPTAAVCRFLRPAKAHPNQTIIDSTYDIVLQRPIGCEYLNPYNNALALLFRCNHDARFVVTSTSRDVAAYICKYVMKPQNRVENDLAFRLAATEKAVGSVDARHGAASLSPRSRGNKIMASLLYTTTNRQELHATMAALLVLRGSFIWQSHQVSGLNMQALLSTLDNIDSVEAVVSAPASLLQEKVQVSHKYDILHAYWNRPNDLETLSLTETVEQFVVVKDKLRRLPKRQIMSVRGKQLIHIDDCTDPESRNLYFKSLNLLFKPHRRGTLLVPGLSHEDSYAQFIQGPPTNATAIAKAYEANLRDSYLAAATPEKKSPEEIILSTHSVFAGLTDDNDHGWSYDSDDDGELQESNDMTILPDFVTHSRLSASNELIARDALLEAAIVQSASTIQEQPFGMHDSTSVDALTNTVAESDGASGTSDFLRHCQTIQTRVERLNECFGPVPWRDPSTTMVLDKSDLPRFPSVATVSLAFKLNFWQHAAFESIARHVLYSYREDIERESGCLFERPTHSDLRTQLVGFLGGEAGTGKSTVIHALLTFAERWGRAGSIETLAFTGVAAINVHGRTLHSARNLSTHSLDAPAPSSEMKQNFSKVVLTIIDEISMTDQSLLGRADAVTRQMSANQDRVWGGRHLLYGGDWFQIPPVGGTTAFKPPEANTKHFAGQGFTAYKSINFVVFLTDNMRARHDSVYTSLMARMRWGALTLDDIAILNTRVGADASNPSTTLPFKPVVVGTNELRCAVNLRAQLEAARTGLVQLYESLAVVPPSSEERLRKFRDFDDHLTGRISLRLLYYIGMPVMITKRVTNPLFKTVFANGTIGHIIGHALQSSSYRQQNVEDVSILRHNQMPKHLVIRVKDCNILLQDGYPPGVFALPPLRDRVTITIPRPQSSSRPDKRKSSDPTMTVVQFPVVPAFACTPEKLQGQTCHDGVVIAALERGGRPASAEGRYVAFSRTVSLEKLTLTQPISLHDAAAFRPKPSLVAEVTRLLQAIVVPTYATPIIIRDFHEWLRRQSL